MKRTLMLTLALLALLPVPCAFAQSDPPDAAASEPAIQEQDVRPIGGAESVDVRLIPAGLTVLPGFRFSQTAETYNDARSFDYISNLGGTLEISRLRQRQRFALNYEGGATFTTSTRQENHSYQTLHLSQSFGIKRWTLSLFDSVEYTPESAIGGSNPFSGLSPALMQMLRNAGVANSLLPSQDIYTIDTPRVSNSLAGQAQYNFNYRTSVTVAAVYGTLRFLERDYLNSNQYTGFASLERMLSPYNTVGVKYSYTLMTYDQIPNGFHTHWFQGNVGRRITNRISAHLSVGPQIVAGSKQVVGNSNIGWASDLDLQYQRNRYRGSLIASRQTTGGAGVLIGARRDSVRLTVSRQLYRRWFTDVQGGYARNVALSGGTGSYNTRSVGGAVRREITPSISAYLSYNGTYQTDSVALPSSTILSGWRHTMVVGLEWHPHTAITRQ